MPDSEIRKHLIQLLGGAEAHVNFHDAVNGFPVDKVGIRPAGSPHSAWQILEHIRIAQADIAHFSGVMDEPSRATSRENPKGYVVLNWPDDYWPKSSAPENASSWSKSVAAVEDELAAFLRLIGDSKRDLFEPFPWGTGQTLLREALLLADHNAYHVGQLMLFRRMVE